ncbi:hypothetical protein CYY_008596 [Polysphondylium violaceum]|uniref:Lipase maturation factor n=1 Tax=Polysphondylium violaceum TaxID=133409 RepID=A0A8J4PN92_9MYCE|nr:hypothetical protein CYY_008596 [Polysphondylium violaceum]
MNSYIQRSINYIHKNQELVSKTFLALVYLICLKNYLQFIVYRVFISPTNDSFALTQWLLLRGLAVIYFISWISLKCQVLGLFGKNGIIPIEKTVTYQKRDRSSIWTSPSLFLFTNTISDNLLLNFCNIGLVCSILLFFDIAPTLNLTVLYIFYLSFKNVGEDFFQLQFDNLLLETGFIALLLPPFKVIPFLPGLEFGQVYHRSIWYLFHFFNIRLLVASGICKLSSGDVNWLNGKALDYHWWTQPMPLSTSYYFQKLPTMLKFVGCISHFLIEIICPILLMIPLFKSINSIALLTLQIMIMVSGNYGTFNLVSLLLGFSFFSDNDLPVVVVETIRDLVHISNYTIELPLFSNLQSWLNVYMALIGVAIVSFTVMMSFIPFSQVFRGIMLPPLSLYKVYMYIEPFGLLNYYGLFAVMTTSRKEIIFQGSIDGVEWKEYEFKYKIGDINHIPLFVLGHLPRLDWRLWFNQFHGFSINGEFWFHSFILKLLKNEKDVMDILSPKNKNMFVVDKQQKDSNSKITPPKYVRAMITPYKFSFDSSASRKELIRKDEQGVDQIWENGKWWSRKLPLLQYSPIAKLSDNGEKLVYKAKI